MRGSQTYLGITSAVLICIDSYDDVPRGRKYDAWHGLEYFQSEMEMLLKMEVLYDDLRFPFPGNNERHFIRKGNDIMKKDMKKVMNDDDILDQHGDLGTFIVRVQHRQNSSWQGRLTWVEKDKTLYFRSVWEMMKLMNEALEDKEADDQTDPSWEENK